MGPEIKTVSSSSPWQDTLPSDILIHIFVLTSQDHGPVIFPTQSHKRPPQLVLSHVCSRWRTLALGTFELWNNVILDDITTLLHHEWFLRARNSPIELSLQLAFRDDDEAASMRDARIIQDTFSHLKLQFQIKMLHIELTFRQFKALSTFPNSILSHIQKLELEFDFDDVEDASCIVPINFTKLQSVILCEGPYWTPLDWNPILKIHLPWAQLRCFLIHINASDLVPLMDTLRQMSLLQELCLRIRSHRSNPSVTPLELKKLLIMSSLRRVSLNLSGNYDEDSHTILRHIACPTLVELDIRENRCSKAAYDIIKQQYNLHELQVLSLGDSIIPASFVLKDAPKLQKIWIMDDMDDDAIAGLSNGTLGRHLKELSIGYCDINRLLSMVEKRKRTVDRLIEDRCSWRGLITVLSKVEVYYSEEGSNGHCKSVYMERVNALKEEGITVTLPNR